MLKPLGLTAIACIISACAQVTPTNTEADSNASSIETMPDNQRLSMLSEIKERMDFLPENSNTLSKQELESYLSKIIDRSYQRYDSQKRGDVLNLNIDRAIKIQDGYEYIMMPVKFTISRSDSRLIPFKDVDFLYSGVHENVRFTYSDNGVLYINGESKGRISLNTTLFTDYDRVQLKDGSLLTLKYSYSLP